VALVFRLLINHVETLGCNKKYLDSLRYAIPKVSCGIDLKITSESKIVDSLVKLDDSTKKYRAIYNLLLDAGLRLVESFNLINDFKGAEEINGFFRCELGDFRITKRAYYGHYSESTYKLIIELDQKLKGNILSHYFYKFGFIDPKYLHEFSFDKKIELEVRESIADFIQSSSPESWS
jgi:intergrase/recombinase